MMMPFHAAFRQRRLPLLLCRRHISCRFFRLIFHAYLICYFDIAARRRHEYATSMMPLLLTLFSACRCRCHDDNILARHTLRLHTTSSRLCRRRRHFQDIAMLPPAISVTLYLIYVDAFHIAAIIFAN